ncbi:MAG: phage major capsid protein [Methylorubrum rhodinum]|uniref:phage major capsid protein n=1 Tax=Methylorubrum rhodinum TaxID=29428 RepID=UPI003BAFEF06
MIRRNLVSGGFAGFLFTVPFGPRPVLDNPENLGAQVMERLDGNHREVKTVLGRVEERQGQTDTALGEVKSTLGALDTRLAEVEQKQVRRGGSGLPAAPKTWGERFVESSEYKAAEGSRDRQGRRYHAVVADTEAEHKNITSVAGSGGALIPVDRRVDAISLLPWSRTTIRDLVAPGTTDSNAITYPRQTGRTNNAAMVAEGALKPQSDMTFEEVTAPVRTLAHFFLVTRQCLDDAAALRSSIDREARSGLADVEDLQMLFGNGTGQNLLGLVPQATPFAKQWTAGGNSTPLDVLIQAKAQVDAQDFTADGLVMNTVDWAMLQSIRDTTGRYIGNSPFEASVAQFIWQLPTATTNKMPRGKFLMGPFRTQAQIFDRLGVEVIASTEDSDNFRRNMVTIRAEERLAFTVQRPASFVYGDLTASLAA